MARKVSSLIMVIVGFLATVIICGYFLISVCSIYTGLPQCIAKAAGDSEAISKCNAATSASIVLMLGFFIALCLPVSVVATGLNIAATFIYRYRKDFKWDARLVFMIICDVLPAILCLIIWFLLIFNPNVS